jgi:hypothetical protein
LNEFFSTCLELLESINNVIHQIYVTGELNAQAKGRNDVFTEADIVIQKTIEINLR